jgi:hypothetical protein
MSAGAAVATLLLSVSLVTAGCGAIKPAELAHEVETIHSVAAEGAILADGVAAGHIERNFARAHASELSGLVDSRAEKLSDDRPPDDPALLAKTNEAIDLAGKVSDSLGDIELSPGDQRAAAKTARDLRQLAAKAQTLGDSL